MKKLMIFCCAMVVSLISLNSRADLSGYDLEKRKIFSDFIFLPITGSDRQGSFLYTRYKKTVSTPINYATGWRSISLMLNPTAINSAEHNQFILDNGILDNRKNLIPADATLCQLSTEARRKISELGLAYTTVLLGGSYPRACSLIIRYVTTAQSAQEKSLVDYLTANSVISLSFRIEEQLSPAINVSFSDILFELNSLGALQKDSLNNYQGPLSAVTYHAAQLPSSLFGETGSAPITFKAWELFLNTFTLSGKTLKVQLNASNEFLSVPAVREEIVNVNTIL
ncbi:MAG: hypothetical protein B0W54_00770 [Cellvibrio sp. 79]|nr:MAG: hypothetical protein B0W54_00770 [Cellvibrio sp. 79]